MAIQIIHTKTNAALQTINGDRGLWDFIELAGDKTGRDYSGRVSDFQTTIEDYGHVTLIDEGFTMTYTPQN